MEAVCGVGTTGPYGSCTACVAGEYKSVTGSAACTLCLEGTYSTITGATTSNTCLACDAGTYSQTTGATTLSTCVACPSDSYSVAGSGGINQCYCNPGYRQTPSHDACSQCDPGYYDSITDRYECSECAGGLYSAAVAATGNETCKTCEAGTWSEAGSPTCQVCPAYSNSTRGSALLTDCSCNPGASGSNGATCVLCPVGKFKAGSGSAACIKCAGGLYSAAVAATGNETCKTCEAGTWSEEGSPTCQVCPAYSNSTRGSALLTDCSCNPGASGSNGATGCFQLLEQHWCSLSLARNCTGRGASLHRSRIYLSKSLSA